MITRIWHGWTGSADAGAYQELLLGEIGPGIAARAIPGVTGPEVLRRDSGPDEVEFVTVMTFADWDAVEAFAGPDRTTAVVPPSARALLRRFDAESQHYETIPLGPGRAT